MNKRDKGWRVIKNWPRPDELMMNQTKEERINILTNFTNYTFICLFSHLCEFVLIGLSATRSKINMRWRERSQQY